MKTRLHCFCILLVLFVSIQRDFAQTVAPIVLNCSSNITVNATSSNGATVFYSVTASGGCSPPPFVTANPPSGSIFPIGTTTVSATASDNCGDSTNCSFTVTVVTPPIVLNCSSNITVNATSSNGATVFYSVTASGGCSPPPFVTANPPSGSIFPIGTTTVSATASDNCGDSTNCSFTVTVVTPPIVLNCSSNITVNATSSNGATVFYSVTASGGCSPPPFVTANPPSGSTFPIGTTTVSATASDNCGDSTNCSFTVTVKSFSLGIAPVGPRIVVSWQTNAASFTLQSITNLFSGSWSNVTSGITIVGTNYTFTNTANGNASFFRLKQ